MHASDDSPVSESMLTSTDSGDGENTREKTQGKGDSRQTWASQLDFVMTAIGGIVGLGNIWRFPYLCYKNGGGAFLVPYIISFLLMSCPVYILEITLGQYTSSGGTAAWIIAPAFQGIGLCTQVILFYMNIYYIIVIVWAIYYLYRSLAPNVPWASCDNSWNTDRCFVSGMNLTSAVTACSNTTDNMTTSSNCSITNVTTSGPRVDAVVEFWERSVLHQSSGIDEVGQLVPGLTIALVLAWVVVYICICKGVRVTGKIVYFTALFPYVLLTVLLIRGATLEGAGNGLKYYLKPDFSRLGDGQVWIAACTQVLYSCGAGQGYMVTMSSYNRYHDNSFRNGIIIMCANYFTSLFGGLCVFSVLGFMAHELGQPIDKVVSAGPGLVFLTYPKAITQLPLSSLWASLFFLLILFVGLDSQFICTEGFTTPILDMFPRFLYKPRNRMIYLAGYCTLNLLLGLTMVTEGGVYVFRLVDFYACSGLVLLATVFFEAVTVGWIFGADRFYDALELMLGYRLGPWMKICWKFLAPVVSMGVLVFQAATFKPLKFDADYKYPGWATALGFFFIANSLLCIPGFFIYRMLTKPGTILERWRANLVPTFKKHQVHPDWHGLGYKWHPATCDDYDVNCDVNTRV